MSRSPSTLETTTRRLDVLASEARHLFTTLLTGKRRLGLWPRVLLGAFAAFVGLVSLAGPIARLLPPLVYWKDVLQMYLLAKAMIAGVDPFLPMGSLAEQVMGGVPYDIATFFPHPTPHPPTLGLLAMPLTLFGYEAAAILWLVIELAMWFVCVCMLGAVVGIRLKPYWVFVLGAFGLAWDPLLQDLAWGQLDVVLLALACGLVLSIRSGRGLVAGLLLGISLLVKQIFWPVVLVLLLKRQWQTVWYAAVVVVVGYSAVAVLVGTGNLVSYFTESLPVTYAHYRAATGNVSLWTLGWKLFDGAHGDFVLKGGEYVPPVIHFPEAAAVVSASVPVTVLLVSLLVTRRRRLETAVGAMSGISIAVSPIAWAHYLVLASLPMAQLAAVLARRSSSHVRRAGACLLLAALLSSGYWGQEVLLLPGSNPGMVYPVLLGSLPVVAAVFIGWLLLAGDVADGGEKAQPVSSRRTNGFVDESDGPLLEVSKRVVRPSGT